jgi:murein DD-endopeptidase MepM/ murein hydrolase activator NlpD
MRILAALVALVVAAWSWPVAPHEVVRAFDPPETPYGAGHRGIDIAAPAGSAVLSPDDGVVRFAGPVAGRPVVSVDHAGGLVSSFEPVEPSVVAGELVTRGQRIGVLLAGHAGGSRLHVGVLHLGARLRGAYVDPLPLLGVARPVLLPMDGREPRSSREAVTPEGARPGTPRRAALARRGCRSASCRGSRDRASPAPP